MDLSNCNIDYIKTCNNDNIGMKSAYLFCNDFLLFFSVFINFHENANFANMITCIFDHRIKGLYLSIFLVQTLVIYD